MSAFDDFLADVTAERCWVLKLDAFQLAPPGGASAAFGDAGFGEMGFGEDDAGSAAGLTTLYYSDNGYTSAAADTPASTWFDGRIAGNPKVERQMFGRQGVGGLTRVNAEVELLNLDGGLDTLPRDYGLDGRRAQLLLGRPTDPLSAFGLVFSGVVAARPNVGFNVVSLALSEASARLDVPINRTAYAGTGAAEGGADLQGKPKPKGWGNCQNVSGPLVDSALLIYQVHDGAISDVPACYDRQVALAKGADYASYADMAANAPAAGNYRVWKGGGFFRLGSTPAGTVTADVLGDASGAGYVNTTADILNRILVDQAGFVAADIDAAAIAQMNVDQPGEVGIWRGLDADTVENVVAELLENAGAFGGFSRAGLFTCAVIKSPGTAAAAAVYTSEDIRSIEREPLPEPVEPIVWRTRVGYQKNYTVQNDVAAAVTAARRTFAAEAERISSKEDAAVLSRHILAREYGATGALFAQAADADTEAVRRLALWKPERGLYSVVVPAPALARDLGNEVTVAYNRFGFDAGVQAMVLGHHIDGSEVTLKVLV